MSPGGVQLFNFVSSSRAAATVLTPIVVFVVNAHQRMAGVAGVR